MTVSAWLTSELGLPPGDLDEYCVWVRQYLAARGILYSTQLLHQRETFLVDLRAAYEGWRDTSPDITQRLSVTASSKVFEDRTKILRAALAVAAASSAAAATHTAAARDDRPVDAAAPSHPPLPSTSTGDVAGVTKKVVVAKSRDDSAQLSVHLLSVPPQLSQLTSDCVMRAYGVDLAEMRGPKHSASQPPLESAADSELDAVVAVGAATKLVSVVGDTDAYAAAAIGFNPLQCDKCEKTFDT